MIKYFKKEKYIPAIVNIFLTAKIEFLVCEYFSSSLNDNLRKGV